MKVRMMGAMAALTVAIPLGDASGQAMPKRAGANVSHAAVHRTIARWANRPRLGAVEMMAKYGEPQEATSDMLIWHNQGPFKRITVFNLETPHDFPMPHVDFLEHTITYNVPQDKVGPLIEFDASSTINRTIGELSARCDLEGHNILTLNLDHDIVMGKKSVQQARESFGENVKQDVLGQHPAYVEALQFQPHSMAAAMFPDKPVVPGSPMRAAVAGAMAPTGAMMRDAEILASVIAIDLNEVLAAAEAGKKRMSAPALAYAKMLHEAHGMDMVATMKLGQDIGITPIITAGVDAMQKKGAGGLAMLVPLDGKPFERGYLAAMVKAHTEVLAMIDQQLLRNVSNDALRNHVTTMRGRVAEHREKARALRGTGK